MSRFGNIGQPEFFRRLDDAVFRHSAAYRIATTPLHYPAEAATGDPMNIDELAAKVAEIEAGAAACRSPCLNFILADSRRVELADLVAALPPGFLKAAVQVARASMAQDDGLASITSVPAEATELDREVFMQQQLVLINERVAATNAFRAIVKGTQ